MAALSKSRLWTWIGGGVAVLLVVGAVTAYVLVKPYAQIGGTYLAKQICSCVFVAGRTDASCHAEFEPDVNKFAVTIHRSSKPGHGWVRTRLLIFKGAATYTEGYGCTVAK